MTLSTDDGLTTLKTLTNKTICVNDVVYPGQKTIPQ